MGNTQCFHCLTVDSVVDRAKMSVNEVHVVATAAAAVATVTTLRTQELDELLTILIQN